MTLKLNVMQNGSTLDLSLFRQTMIFKLGHTRKTFAILDSDAIVYSIITMCSRGMRCSADKEAITKLDGSDVHNLTILAELNEYLFSSI
jgi:hypothetical protein